MSTRDNFDQEDDRSFLEKNGKFIGFGVAALLIAGFVAAALLLTGKPMKPKPPELLAIHLLPPPPSPPPPPPPKPPPPPPPQPKMVEQPPLKPNEAKPKPEMKAPDRPPAPGPVASGPASDDGIGGGGGSGSGGEGGGGGGSRFGYYANEVVGKITDAVHQNTTTRNARAHVKVRIWLDGTGRVTRAKLDASSDDASVDTALQNEVLAGLVMPEAPPSDMPMPIVMLLSEVRPN